MDKSILTKEDAEEFVQSAAQHGTAQFRQVALAKKMEVHVALGISLEELVIRMFGGYMKLSITERREAVKELAAQGYTNVDIAKITGVSDETVRRDKATNVVDAKPDQAQRKPRTTNVDAKLKAEIARLTEQLNAEKEKTKSMAVLKTKLNQERKDRQRLENEAMERLAAEQEKKQFDEGVGVSDPDLESKKSILENPDLLDELSRREVVFRAKSYIQWLSALDIVIDDLQGHVVTQDDEIKVLQDISAWTQTISNKVQTYLSDTQRRTMKVVK